MNDRFLSLFFEEARELLQALEAGLMDLEARQGDREHLDRTFRAAHTLKGAAGMVGLRPIAEFTHKVEAVLDDIRSGRMAVSRGAITILLRAKDHLGVALDEAVEGRTTEAPADLVEASWASRRGGPHRRRNPCPSRVTPAACRQMPPIPRPRRRPPRPSRRCRPMGHRAAIGSSFAPGPISSARGSTPSGSSTSCESWATHGSRPMSMPSLPWRS